MNTFIYLVRHGQSFHNLRGLVAGQSPSSLTQQGQEDARIVGQSLKKISFDLIYSSDLLRAQQTAETIKNILFLKCPLHVSVLLRELDFGEYTNRPVSEAFAFLNYREIRNKRYPGGEGFEDLKQRISLFIKKLSNEFLGLNILVTAHAGSIRMLLGLLDLSGQDKWFKQVISNQFVAKLTLDRNGDFNECSVFEKGENVS